MYSFSEKFKTRAKKFIVWSVSSIVALSSVTPALSQTKSAGNKLNRYMRNQIKISRLKSEVQGNKFVPTQEMMQEAPEFVKSQMDLHQNYLKRLNGLQQKTKTAEARAKLFQKAYDNGGASLGELQKNKHRHSALKAKLLHLQSQALSDLEDLVMESSKEKSDHEIALEIKMARIKAELNETTFKPTDEMKKAKPNLVELEMKIFKNNTEHLDIIDARIEMTKAELELSESAHKKGAISKTELITIKKDLNKLSNYALLLHANILQEREYLEHFTAAEENLEWVKKTKQARINAQLSGEEFTPTKEMQIAVPKVVELEQKLFATNMERLNLLSERETLLKEKFKLVSAAHKSGVASNAEHQDAKVELQKTQSYLKKLASHMKRELRFAEAG